MTAVPEEWLRNGAPRRVICHWTGGAHRASDLDREHYHILIEHDGTVVRGVHDIADNDRTGDGNYAAHTLNANTRSIGVAVCCMHGATETPFRAGAFPMTETQWQAMIAVVAALCRRYGIAVTPRTVLGHGEVQANLGIRQKGKWDPLTLPWRPALGKRAVGDLLRDGVHAALEAVPAPGAEPAAYLTARLPEAELPVLSFNGEDWVHVADLVERLGWSVTDADAEGARLATAGGETLAIGHCFAADREASAAWRALVTAHGLVDVQRVARALGLRTRFDAAGGRLVLERGAAPAPPPAAPDRVTVEPGDTLYRIAERHLGAGGRWRALRTETGRAVTDADAATLEPGMVILLPDADAPAAAPVAPEDERSEDVDVLARTLWGEARNQGADGKQAVAAVVLNRLRRGPARRFGATVAGVCLKRWQFSCWNPGNPNRPRLLAVTAADAAFRECLEIARAAVAGALEDPTAGADHYHARRVRPGWARGRQPCTAIGAHLFYNDIP